ncbi:MAG: maleylpyruvate isomerase family mycothiol-dependent enzyme [Acidimicrobiia bacterium]|nr:maleylpyruvate isomerase family mycothiol-dependent enzyme [Acidimicrobiia bacterium]
MNTDRLIEALDLDGKRMATIAADLPLDTPVPSCPDWKLRQLLRHLGWVHRWAGTIILEKRTERPGREEITPDGWPPDQQLVDWFRQGHRRVVTALEEAPDDLECWKWRGLTSPRAFWTRRQAHETAIHRVDIELTVGEPVGFDPDFASDGIDELMVFFLSLPDRGPRTPEPLTLRVVASDTGRQWTASLGPEASPGLEGGEGPAGCTVTGRASDLYLYLWNRAGSDDLLIEGDGAVLDCWFSGPF